MAAQGLATALEQEGVWLLPAPLQSVFRLDMWGGHVRDKC